MPSIIVVIQLVEFSLGMEEKTIGQHQATNQSFLKNENILSAST